MTKAHDSEDAVALAIPLNQDQIDAACRLHAQLDQWSVSDAALEQLRRTMPDFGLESCLLKCVAINALYGTNVYAMTRMGKHVHEVIAKYSSTSALVAAGPALVQDIAALDDRGRIFISFASKFCHFFIDNEQFPIYDDAARLTLLLHLGKGALQRANASYAEFCQATASIRSEAKIQGQCRDVDRYLWITGMYIKWKREAHKPDNEQQTNVELRRIFRNPTGERGRELDLLLPFAPETRQASILSVIA